MKAETLFSYLLNSIKKPSLFDIKSISTDFMTRLLPEQVESLNNTVLDTPFHRGSKPCNEAQMNALIHAEIINVAHWLEYILLDLDRDACCANDCVVIDYDCGIGLSSVAMIHCFNEICTADIISEVILIEEDEFCISIAELLVKSMLPSATVRTIKKSANNIVPDDIKNDHILVYNLFCGRYTRVNDAIINMALKNIRYQFVKTIIKLSSLDGSYNIENREYETKIDLGTHLIIMSDLLSIQSEPVEKTPQNNYDYFCAPKDVMSLNAPCSKNYDPHYLDILSFIEKKDSSAINCYAYFERLSDRSPLAKLNLAKCLYFGVGIEQNKERAISILKSMESVSEDDFKALVLREMALMLDNEDEQIALWNKVISLDIPENEKCTSRCNIAYLRRGSNNENERLYRKCIEFGCKYCKETLRYNREKRSCPKAQYQLGLILWGRNDKENAVLQIKKSANQGYVPAMNIMGQLYVNGKYVENDIETAISLWKEAASSGDIAAQKFLFKYYKNNRPTDAFRYLTMACNSKDIEALKLMLEFLPNVLYGDLRDQQKDYCIITLALNGVDEYKLKASNILVRRGDELMRHEEIEKARKYFEILGTLDDELSKQKLKELEENTPDWYYEKDIYNEGYSYEESLMDALDDTPDAYWNID